MNGRVVDGILEEVRRLQAGGMLMSGLRMKALPALFKKAVELADVLVEGKEESRGAVVRALQDMFEIFTKVRVLVSLVCRCFQPCRAAHVNFKCSVCFYALTSWLGNRIIYPDSLTSVPLLASLLHRTC